MLAPVSYAQDATAFITTWQVNAGEQIVISTTGGGYNYQIDWGDGNSDSNLTGPSSHTYTVAGTYTVKISGDFPLIIACSIVGNRQKLRTIEQWGSQAWRSMSGAFRNCNQVTLNATDAPNLSNVSDMSEMFYNAHAFNGNIGTWNVGAVTNMDAMFDGAKSFNQDIGSWNVSRVSNMEHMFHGASSFNQDISRWNISQVSSMDQMLVNTALTTAHYDRLLNAWSKLAVKKSVTLGVGTVKYSTAGEAARTILTDQYTWSILDGGPLGDTSTKGKPGQPVLTLLPGDKQLTLSWSPVAHTKHEKIAWYEYKQFLPSKGKWKKWQRIINSHPEGVNANSYVLTGLNNNTPYTLKLRAVDVNGVNGPVSAEVTGTPFVPSVNISTDTLTVDEGSTGDYTVVLGSQPTGDVTITPTSGDADIATLMPASLTFTDTNWDTPQTITVTGVNDDKDNGTHRDVTITHRAVGGGYDGVLIADVGVHVTDDDTAGVDVTETGGDTQVSEGGTQDTFSVVLTSEPDADVVIGISSSDTGEATVGPASLTFTDTNWDRPQIVTVTGVNDDIADGVQAIEINLANAVSTDVDYGGKFSSHVDVSVADDDNTGIRLSNALLRVDEGSTGDYTVVLGSQPTGDVTITPTSGDADIATLMPASLTFTDTNWDTPQTITVTGVNDDKDNGTHRDVTITHRAVGGGYDGVLIADVGVHVTDDDTAGVDVTETGGDTQVSEGGTQDTFSVVLTSEPDADVVIGISSSDTGEATVGPASLTFTDTNWDRPQIVTVTGVNDDIADGVQAIEINLANAVSTDVDYGGKFSSHVDVSVADDDNTGIRLSNALLRVDEGSTGDYTVVLGSQPTGDVTITPTSGDADIATLMPASLTFTDTNWDTPQTITVTGVNDDKDNGTHRDVTITHRATGGGYDGVLIADVGVHVTDDDTAGVDVTETGGDTQVSEGGTQDTFSVVLTSEPDADVVIGISSSDTGEATVGPASLTFTDTNWDRPQIVTVTGVNDDIADGVQAIEINLANAVSTDVDYGGKFSSHVDVSVADDDNTGIRLSNALLRVDEGSTGDYTVVLGSQPTGDVTITPTSGDADIATLMPASLTFTDTNWDTPQTITVTGVNDDKDNGTHRDVTITHRATGGGYDGVLIADVGVHVTDDDTAGVDVTETGGDTQVSEGGTQDTFSVVLTSEPDADVVIGISSSDTGEATVGPASLTFTDTNWDRPQTITVTGVNDDIADGVQAIEINLANAVSTDVDYGGKFSSHVDVSVADDDNTGIRLSNALLRVDEGSTGDYTVVLGSQPTGDVTITPTSGDADIATLTPATLTFTDTNWDTPQTITVTGVNDDKDNGTHRDVTITHRATGGGYDGVLIADVGVHVTDDDTAGVDVTETGGDTQVSEGGTQDTFSVVLTSEPDADVVIGISSSDTGEATVLPASLTFTDTNWDRPQIVTVTGVNDDIADGVQAIEINLANAVSTDVDYGGKFSSHVDVSVADDDNTGIRLSNALLRVDEGSTGDYTVVLGSQPTGGGVMITPTSGDAGIATLTPATLTFTDTNWDTPQTITVTGVNDDKDNGTHRDVTITHRAVGGGYDGVLIADVDVHVTDDDTAGVDVTETGGDTQVSEGGTQDTFSVVLTSEPDADVVIGISSSDTGEATVLPASLTFTDTNWDRPQIVTVTGVNDDIADGVQAIEINLANAVSTDGDYNGQFGQTITVTVTDNDAPGITIVQTDGDTTVSETGTQDTFTVVLNSEPTADVVIGISSSDAGEATVLPATLTFTDTNWHVAQSVTVTGQDDDVADGDQQVNISLANAVSTDGDYSGQFGQTITVTVTDNDAPGITILQTGGDTTVSETGTQDTFSVVLNSEPTADVVIGISSSDTGEATVGPASLTFTDTNWHVAQSVTVTGQDDDVADGDQQVDISLANAVSTDGDYNGQFGQTITVTVTDNDAPGITIVQTDGDTTVSETGTQDTFTVVLNSEPTADVVIGISSSDAGEATVLPATLTFTVGNWHVAQSVTVTGQDDDVADGDQQVNISLANAVSTDGDYNGQFGQTITVTVTDNDAPGITIVQTDGDTTVSETGTQDTFTVVLNSEPTADVVIGISSSDAGEATVLPATLTFTVGNWHVAQSVTVTGQDDDVADGDQQVNISLANAVSTDGDYNGQFGQTITVTVTDNDAPGITIVQTDGDTTVSETGTQDTFSVVLTSEPDADVVIGISSSDAGEATVLPASLTFTDTNWHVAQSVTVTGQDDDVADGDQQVNISLANAVSTDGDYNGQFGQTITVEVTDDDAPGITIVQTDGDTTVSETGTQDTFSVVLTSEPDADVVIGISSSDTGEATVGPATLTFTDTNWDVAQSVTVTGQDDDVADGDQQVNISLANAVSTDGDYNGQFGQTIAVTVTDNDAPGITIVQTGGDTTVSEGGTQDTFSVVLTSEPDVDVVIGISSSDTGEATVLPATLTFTDTNWDRPQIVTVTGVNDDIADGVKAIEINLANAVSTDGDYGGKFSSHVDVSVADDDNTGIRLSRALLTVDEGSTGDYTVVLGSQPTGDVTITPTSGDADIATLTPTTLTFTDTNWGTPQTITVTGVNDDKDNGTHRDVTITHRATGGGYDGVLIADVGVHVTDDDTAGVDVTETGGDTQVSEGGTQDTFSVVLTSEPDADVVIGISSSDAGEATVLPATLTFTDTNWDRPQIVTVTGVNDDIADGVQAIEINLANAVSTDVDYGGKFSSHVDVSVADDDNTGIRLSNALLRVDEGSTGDYTVVLGSQPTGDVTITPTSGDADIATLMPASLTFTDTNWDTPQTITVTGVNDDKDNGTHRDVTITHRATGGGYDGVLIADVGVHVTDDDTAGVDVTETGGDTQVSEGGTQDTFSVVLTSEPDADVVIGISSSDTGEATVGPASLTFTDTNWDRPQIVTVTGVNDDIADGVQAIEINLANAVSTDGDYNGQFGQTITMEVTDNDTPGITTVQTGGDTTVSETGTQDTFTVVLNSEPTANVSIAVSSSDEGEATVLPASLTFTDTNWNVAKTVTVTGQDDDVADGDQQVNISLANAVSTDGDYSGQFGQTITVEVTDDDAALLTSGSVATLPPIITLPPPSVMLSVSSLLLDEGGTGEYTVVLGAQPTGEVVITVSSGDAGIATLTPTTLTFTDTNWDRPQTITVTGVDDAIDNGTHRDVTITHRAVGGGYDGVPIDHVDIRVNDNDNSVQRDMAAVDKSIAPQVVKAMTHSFIATITERLATTQAIGTQPQHLRLNGHHSLVSWVHSSLPAMQDGTISWKQQLLDSDFSIPLAQLFSLSDPTQSKKSLANLSLWGSGEYKSIDNGESGQVQWDGKVGTFSIGVDSQYTSQLLLGTSLHWSEARIAYDEAEIAGEYRSDLISIHPYFNWLVTDNSALWLIGGYGEGDVEVIEKARTRNSDSSLLQLAVGGETQLLRQSQADEAVSTSLLLKIHTAFSRFDIHGYNRDVIDGLEFATRQTRLALDGSHRLVLGNGDQLIPSLEFSIRDDSGDGQTGLGSELGVGLRYEQDLGLSTALKWWRLLRHTGGLEEWGISGMLALQPHNGLGFSLKIQSDYGDSSSTWQDKPFAHAKANGTARTKPNRIKDYQLNYQADVGYGVSVMQGQSVLTPYTGIDIGKGTNRHRLGARLAHKSGIAWNVQGERHRSSRENDNRVAVTLEIPWD